jgi:hypothetical protein
MKFLRIVFATAAAYGFISLLPLYFLLGTIGRDAPPSVTHPEFYYGFVGVTLLWQLVFVLISLDPIRYRPIMWIAIVEKVIYTTPVLILFSIGEVQPKLVAPSLIDPIFGALFFAASIGPATPCMRTVNLTDIGGPAALARDDLPRSCFRVSPRLRDVCSAATAKEEQAGWESPKSYTSMGFFR